MSVGRSSDWDVLSQFLSVLLLSVSLFFSGADYHVHDPTCFVPRPQLLNFMCAACMASTLRLTHIWGLWRHNKRKTTTTTKDDNTTTVIATTKQQRLENTHTHTYIYSLSHTTCTRIHAKILVCGRLFDSTDGWNRRVWHQKEEPIKKHNSNTPSSRGRRVRIRGRLTGARRMMKRLLGRSPPPRQTKGLLIIKRLGLGLEHCVDFLCHV